MMRDKYASFNSVCVCVCGTLRVRVGLVAGATCGCDFPFCVFVCPAFVLDAVSGSHDPVGSNQRSPASVPPLTIPLVLKRDLKTK